MTNNLKIEFDALLAEFETAQDHYEIPNRALGGRMMVLFLKLLKNLDNRVSLLETKINASMHRT
jgi:hypothetical protein